MPLVRRSFWKRLGEAPLELRAFIVFAAAVTVADLFVTLIGPRGVREAVLPVTGWVPSMGYFFSLVPASMLVSRGGLRFRNGAVGILLVHLAFGLWGWLWAPGQDRLSNPYLWVHPLRPLWAVALPALWIVVLLSPRIRAFCGAPRTETTSND